jgi:hypothetical protein
VGLYVTAAGRQDFKFITLRIFAAIYGGFVMVANIWTATTTTITTPYPTVMIRIYFIFVIRHVSVKLDEANPREL